MSTPPTATKPAAVPLCVDLDGTFLLTDMLWEGLVRLLRRNPLYAFAMLAWWCRGRACLKREIARRVEVPVETLPYTKSFLEYLRAEQAAGRAIFLVTASDQAPAESVAVHAGLFSGVLASDGQSNLRGAAKSRKLVERFGKGGFDYAGNSPVDLGVWPQAREAVVVNGTPSLVRRVERVANLGPTFECGRSFVPAFVKALRPYQWIKNLIVFVPILTAHRLFDWPTMRTGVWAAAAFSICSSAVYVLNDLLDVDADRAHPSRRSRPFASGALPLPVGLTLVPILFAAALGLALAHSLNLLVVITTYALLTVAYSWWLKQVVLLDVFLLAGFYILRLIAGHEATGIVYSVWLLVFAMFVFLSLAFVKRFRELQGLRQRNQTGAAGRGYVTDDLELIAALGTSSGWLATLVLALYVNSQEVRVLYAHPMLLLLVCPLLLFWISRVWLVAHRGAMHDDPVFFAIKDGASYVVGGLTLLVLWLATGW